jgi:hypothetical protein
MVNDYEGSNNPQRDPLETRASVEAVRRLRQILNGERCIVCASLISPTNPAVLTIYDLSICRRPECAAVILDVPLSELIDSDNEEVGHE